MRVHIAPTNLLKAGLVTLNRSLWLQAIDGEEVPGKYRLRLFDGAREAWEEVEVDDRIPCIDKKWYERPTPVFAKNNGAELYVMLLEKAFAKVC